MVEWFAPHFEQTYVLVRGCWDLQTGIVQEGALIQGRATKIPKGQIVDNGFIVVASSPRQIPADKVCKPFN